MANVGPLIASIKISKFIRWIYLPYVKLRVKVTGQEADLDKVMQMVEKFTTVTVTQGENHDSGNQSERDVH